MLRLLPRVSCPIFAMQILVSVVGMVTSVGMLWLGRDPAVYLPITTSIIGYWLPAPKKPMRIVEQEASSRVSRVSAESREEDRPALEGSGQATPDISDVARSANDKLEK